MVTSSTRIASSPNAATTAYVFPSAPNTVMSRGSASAYSPLADRVDVISGSLGSATFTTCRVSLPDAATRRYGPSGDCSTSTSVGLHAPSPMARPEMLDANVGESGSVTSIIHTVPLTKSAATACVESKPSSISMSTAPAIPAKPGVWPDTADTGAGESGSVTFSI